MMKKCFIFVCMLILNFNVSHYVLFSSEELNLKEKFLSEAPLRWQAYFDYSTKLEGSIVFLQLDKNGNVLTEQSMIINNIFPTYSIEVLTKSKVNNQNVEKTVKGYNPKYSFELKESKTNSWEVIGLNKYDNRTMDLNGFKYAMPFQDDQSIKNRGLDFLRSRLVGGVELTPLESLPLLVSLPEFELLSIDYKIIDEVKYIEIIYKFEPPQEKYPIVVGSGKFLLYPDTWLIKSGEFYRANTNNSIIYYINNEYNFDNHSMPIITKRTKKSLSGDTFRSLEETLYNLHETQDKNLKRVSLSHYGLPEPDFGDRRANRIRYVIMIGGLILIGIGAWRMLQKRRENA